MWIEMDDDSTMQIKQENSLANEFKSQMNSYQQKLHRRHKAKRKTTAFFQVNEIVTFLYFVEIDKLNSIETNSPNNWTKNKSINKCWLPSSNVKWTAKKNHESFCFWNYEISIISFHVMWHTRSHILNLLDMEALKCQLHSTQCLAWKRALFPQLIDFISTHLRCNLWDFSEGNISGKCVMRLIRSVNDV